MKSPNGSFLIFGLSPNEICKLKTVTDLFLNWQALEFSVWKSLPIAVCSQKKYVIYVNTLASLIHHFLDFNRFFEQEESDLFRPILFDTKLLNLFQSLEI